MAPLTRSDIVGHRIANLQLAGTGFSTPGQIVTWLGAMQAQDLGSGKWSFGVRLPDSTEASIDAVIASGEVLRTWPMRGTIHFVPAVDARWMLQATGVRMLSGVGARWQYLGLDQQTVDRGADLLDTALKTQPILTRAAALQVLADAGMDVSGQRGYHLIWYASQIGVTCLGPQLGKEQTLVRLSDWAPEQVSRDVADGLRELALRFVRSHGPVTHQDLARWAGVGAREAKAAITANDGEVAPVQTQVGDMWIAASTVSGPPPAVLLLPGFDEFILGYKDRSLVLADQFKARIVPGNNGVFRPTVVLDGQVRATWRRRSRARFDLVEVEPFVTLAPRAQRRIEDAFSRYGAYLGRDVQVQFL